MKTLYLSDLDGTLLTPEAALSPFTAETLRRLLGSGMAFSYATARSFSTAKKVTAALKGARLPVIVYNGAAIVEAESGAVLDAVYFTPAETAFIRGVLEAAGLRPMVYSRAKAHVRAERVAYVEAGCSRGLAQYLEPRRGDERLHAVEPKALYGGRAFYFTVIADSRAACEAPYAALCADGRFIVHLQRDVYSDAYYFEIMPKGASKAQAAKRLMALSGCTRLVCFGDGENDRSMFRIADAGYAVENAAEALKAEAAAVILSNQSDGVAHKLLELWAAETDAKAR